MSTGSAAGLSSRSGLYAHRARALVGWRSQSAGTGTLCAYAAALCDGIVGVRAGLHFARSDGGWDRSRGVERVSSAKPKKMPAGQRSGEDPLTFT
jgi:hypothetical protein